MQFRLIYDGPLRSTQREPQGSQIDPRHEHKHAIRRALHPQLKQLWEINKNLCGPDMWENVATWGAAAAHPPKDITELSQAHSMYGWNFVPLVTEPMDLVCNLQILLLRRGNPGKVIQSGDIDNRLKTLFDALTLPTPHDRYADKFPQDGESPMFCLLADDRLVTHVSVETDQLLIPSEQSIEDSNVHIIINVKIRPYTLRLYNAHFG